MRLFCSILLSLFLLSCQNPQEVVTPELHGWIETRVIRYQYTPQTLTVWVEKPESVNEPDSILVLNPCVKDTIISSETLEVIFNQCNSDTSYSSTHLFTSNSNEVSVTFSFPPGYLSVFYPPNTYIYNYRLFELRAFLHFQ